MAEPEVIMLDDDDDDDGPVLQPTAAAASPSSFMKVKENMQVLWKRKILDTNGLKDHIANKGPHLNGYKLEKISAATTTIAAVRDDETPPNSGEDSGNVTPGNIFDILGTPTLNDRPESPREKEELPRKRIRIDNGSNNGDCSRSSDIVQKEKPSNNDAAAINGLAEMRKCLKDRLFSQLSGRCDCMKNRRELEDKVSVLTAKLTELAVEYNELQEKNKTLASKLESASQVERRTIAIQVDASIFAASVSQETSAKSAATSVKAVMPTLTRYPSPSSRNPVGSPVRAPAQAVSAQPPNTTQAKTVLVSISGPVVMPQKPTAPPTNSNTPSQQAQKHSSAAVDQITLVSSTGVTTKIVRCPNGANTTKQAPQTAVAASSSATPTRQNANSKSPTSATTATARIGSGASPLALGTANVLPPMMSKPNRMRNHLVKVPPQVHQPQRHSPPRLTRAPNAVPTGPQIMRKPTGPLFDARMMFRTTGTSQFVQGTQVPFVQVAQLSAGARLPLLQVPPSRPPAPQMPPARHPAPPMPPGRPPAPLAPHQPPQPQRQPIINAVRSPPVQSCAFPPLPELKMYVAPDDLNAASAQLRPLPPKPILSVARDQGRVTLTWDMPSPLVVELREYRIYSFKAESGEPWTIVGGVEPLDLPMACTLSSCVPGYKYYFALTAEDEFGRFGPFSDVCWIRM